MNMAAETPPDIAKRSNIKRTTALLGIIVAAFLVLRIPLMSRQQGGTDEAFFAVPGRTISQEGIPRIPYLPVRDKTSVFYQADQILFCLPPAHFYWQAIFFTLLPDSYLTARLASATAGLLTLGFLYLIARQCLGSEASGIWAVGLFSLSRLFFFPATSTRPDILCGMWGIAAVLAAWKWSEGRRKRTLVISGLLLGLGLLTHPFAIVYCLQISLWVVLVKQSWKQRLANGLLLLSTAAAAFALWLPLILLDREVFWIQFSNNVLHRAGPGLLSRCLMPAESLRHHFQLLVEHAQLPQLLLLSAGLLMATALALWQRKGPLTRLVLLTWSSIYLLVTISGIHPVKGYWCYPGALLALCTTYSLLQIIGLTSNRRPGLSRTGTTTAILLSLLLMVPGLGLRAWISNIQNWSQAAYNQPELVRQILKEYPPDARLVVDPAFVFDVSLARQKVTFGSVTDIPAEEISCDYLIVGPLGRQQGIAKQFGGRSKREFGKPGDPFACFAEVYQITDPRD